MQWTPAHRSTSSHDNSGPTPAPSFSIVNVHDHPGGLASAVDYLHTHWGSAHNRAFYDDAIRLTRCTAFATVFVLETGFSIVGSYGLITNDFISRHDLMPWLCCLYVAPEWRGRRLSALLFEHAASGSAWHAGRDVRANG